MSTVLNDVRVVARGAGFTVRRESGLVEVIYTPGGTFGWAICAGTDLEYLPMVGGGFAIGFPSAEAAVEAALTGEPQVAV